MSEETATVNFGAITNRERLVNFRLMKPDFWTTARYKINGESICYNIIKDDASKEGYVLKKYSFVIGCSINSISRAKWIEPLVMDAETDLIREMGKDKNILAMLLSLLLVDKITELKKFEDNELYDYLQLRKYIVDYILKTCKPISIWNRFLLILMGFNRKKAAKDIIDRVQTLLLIETTKESETGNHTDIPEKLSEILNKINKR